MRVLHVTPYLDASAGGPPVVVERLADKAEQFGFQANILTTAAYTHDGGQALGAHSRVTVIARQSSVYYGTGRTAVDEAVGAADILHLHTMWSPLIATVAASARQRGIPYVVSPHGMLDPYSLGRKALKKSIYFRFIERRMLANAARIIFTTESEEELASAVVGSLPSKVIALGADTPSCPSDELSDEFRTAHQDIKGPLVVFLGRLHEKKRPDAVIAAMPEILTRISDATLIMVGSGNPAVRRALEAQADMLGLGNAVRFLGHLSGEEKWQALAAASVFVLPSRQENFAIAVAEALHAGVPVLLTEAVAIAPEIIAAGAGRLISSDRVEQEIAEGVVAYLSDPVLQARTAENARALAAQSYSWNECARATHELYGEILAGNTTKRPT